MCLRLEHAGKVLPSDSSATKCRAHTTFPKALARQSHGICKRNEGFLRRTGLNIVRFRGGCALPAAVDASASQDVLSKLTEQILELEAELQIMFSGEKGPMPKAAVVNKVREDLSLLKSQLAELLEEEGHQASTTQQPASSWTLKTTKVEELHTLDKAKLVLEGVMRPKPGGGLMLGTDPELAIFDQERALLETENEHLREKALLLLTRQQILEELVAEKNVKVIKGAGRKKASTKLKP